MQDGSARKASKMMTVLVGGASSLWQYLGGEKVGKWDAIQDGVVSKLWVQQGLFGTKVPKVGTCIGGRRRRAPINVAEHSCSAIISIEPADLSMVSPYGTPTLRAL